MRADEFKPDLGNPTITDLNWSRWFFLTLVFVVLSTTGLLSIFAPAPVLFAFLMYGKNKTYLMGAAGLVLTYVLALTFDSFSPMLFGVILLAFVYAICLGQIFARSLPPAKGLTKIGLSIVGAMFVIFGAFLVVSDVSLLAELEKIITVNLEQYRILNPEIFKAGGDQARYLEDIMANPTETATNILGALPSLVFIGVFLSLWTSLLTVLRASHIWSQKVVYPYSSKDLIKFSVPAYFVYILIAGLALVLLSDLAPGLKLEYIGGNILACLGVFYFFQGFGLYIDLLNKIKITGLIRTLFVIFTIWSLWHVVVLFGVFDQWFDFRKYIFRNKEK